MSQCWGNSATISILCILLGLGYRVHGKTTKKNKPYWCNVGNAWYSIHLSKLGRPGSNIIGMLQTSTMKREARRKGTAPAPSSHLNLGFVQGWNARIKLCPEKPPHTLPGGTQDLERQRKKAVKSGTRQPGITMSRRCTKGHQNAAQQNTV